MKTKWCNGTSAGPCRSGHSGGAARLRAEQALCGGCSRRARRAGEVRPEDSAEHAEAAAALRDVIGGTGGDVGLRVEAYRRSQASAGSPPSERTLAAVREFMEAADMASAHAAAPGSLEVESFRRGRPQFRRSDREQRRFWMLQTLGDMPADGSMVLSARWKSWEEDTAAGELVITVSGPTKTRSECCDAAPVAHEENETDSAACAEAHLARHWSYRCGACRSPMSSTVHAQQVVAVAGGMATMPCRDAFVGHAYRSAAMADDVTAKDALVTANEHLDQFARRGFGNDDVHAETLTAAAFRDGEVGLVERARSPGDDTLPAHKAAVCGFVAVSDGTGRRLLLTDPVETDRTDTYLRCLVEPSGRVALP